MRYIGNKYKLLNVIDSLLISKGIRQEGLVFCDIFTGTATVANSYNNFYRIVANDFLEYSYYIASGLLEFNNSGFKNLHLDPIVYFNSVDTSSYVSGFCYNNFSPNAGRMYFSDENAKFIDYVRDTIDKWFDSGLISKQEKAYLICCLLESVSKVANVAGVYSAFLRIWDPRATKRMIFLPVESISSRFDNIVYCEDANILIRRIDGDILYIDPPYTPTQYNSQYHVLETIARNDNPDTHGLGAHRDNDRLSKWCVKGKVEYEFEDLIFNARFPFIIFSYSDKGLMSLKFIESVLKRYAKPDSYAFQKISFVKYKSTRAVIREHVDNTEDSEHYEYLFYIEKSEDVLYSSPLNYIGGKYDALPLIKSNLPNEKINVFYDLFGGGGTVSLNVEADKIVYNDINFYVKDLLEYLALNDWNDIYRDIAQNIKKFSLSKENKEAYMNLRKEYNSTKSNILLYLLLCYGFEHQIRFNSKYEFNNPCGNSGFNDELMEKLICYNQRCRTINIEFNSKSYEDFLNDISENDFVYLDPPYLDNLGVYNDGKRGFNGWDSEQQKNLCCFIEELNRRHIKFMLSNFTDHNENDNDNLIHWALENGFKIIYDKKITKRNRQDRRELIIINY